MSSRSFSRTASSRAAAAARDTDALRARRHKADLERNRKAWDGWAPDYFEAGLEQWSSAEPRWGIWGTPESELGLLAEVEPGTDVIELGCGTAYVCAWLARLGAVPVGVDISEEQLESARMLQRQFGLQFPLVRASADNVPFEDASFDLAISEYGASIWVDPHAWIPEAARLLRPGGKLVFVVNGATLMTCTPEDGSQAGGTLERPYFGMHRFEFPGDESVEFHLAHGDWIRLLRAQGLDVIDLIEVQAAERASTRYPFVTAEWARWWPSEEIWIAQRRA